MADLTITSTAVIPVTTSPTANLNARFVQFGEAVTAGQPIYQKSTDSKWYKAQCDGTAEESGSGTQIGLAIAGGSTGQWGLAFLGGNVTIGTGSVGVMYVVSATAGGIAPISDLVSTNKVTFLGQVVSTGVLALNPQVGTALP